MLCGVLLPPREACRACTRDMGKKVVVQGKTYDASAKLEGRSMVMAPP